MSVSPLDSDYVVEQYEELRQEALEPPWSGSVGHGLALFLSRGMSAWMEALRMINRTTVADFSSTPRWRNDLPATVRCDVTLLLADMVMACHGREMQSDGHPGQNHV